MLARWGAVCDPSTIWVVFERAIWAANPPSKGAASALCLMREILLMSSSHSSTQSLIKDVTKDNYLVTEGVLQD